MLNLAIRTNPASAEVLAGREQALLKVEDMCRSQVQWYETKTAAEYRRLRAEGIGFPKLSIYEGAKTVTTRARDGHLIELRVIANANASQGLLLHFHAGGFVIGSCRSYDNYLSFLSKNMGLTIVSVEYRLAPEHPHPAGHHDALDATKFALSPEGEKRLGGKVRILAGESAGGCLASWVALALRDECGIDVRSKIAAIIHSYPILDMSYTPSLIHHTREAVLSKEGMIKFIEATFPNVPFESRKDPQISPLYADLRNMPPALFLCGTEDPLLDDSAFMAARWSLAGNDAELCLIPGAWHAFTLIPAGEVTEEGLGDLVRFAKRHL